MNRLTAEYRNLDLNCTTLLPSLDDRMLGSDRIQPEPKAAAGTVSVPTTVARDGDDWEGLIDAYLRWLAEQLGVPQPPPRKPPR